MVEPTTSLDLGPKVDSAGEAVRTLREQAGLSLRDLAERTGWDKGRLSKYENNQLAMSLPVLDRIAQGLGMAPLVVLLHCLRHRYPALKRPNSEVGSLLQQLVDELSKPTRASSKR